MCLVSLKEYKRQYLIESGVTRGWKVGIITRNKRGEIIFRTGDIRKELKVNEWIEDDCDELRECDNRKEEYESGFHIFLDYGDALKYIMKSTMEITVEVEFDPSTITAVGNHNCFSEKRCSEWVVVCKRIKIIYPFND